MRNTKRNIQTLKFLLLFVTSYFMCNSSEAQQLYPSSFDITTLNGTNGFRIPGIDLESQFGAETKFIGDINNDGFEDIAIGVQLANPNTLTRAGAAYVVFGSSSGFSETFDITSIDGTNGFVVVGTIVEERMGTSVSGLGDINGDGIDDMGIRSKEGIMILYGKTSGFDIEIDLTDINGTNGFVIDHAFGLEISYLGDVNGDTIDDFIISNGGGGEAWIFFGRSSNFPSSVDVSWLDGINGFRTSGYSNTLRAAYLAGGAGDINNDGFNDIILGDRSLTSGSFIERTHLIYGRNSFNPLVDITALDGTEGFTIDHTGGNFLAFTGTLGDINADGIDDFFSESAAIFGKQPTDPFPANIPLSSVSDRTYGFILPGGLTSAPVGDINQDGINDFISVYGSSGSDRDAYVIFGSNSGFPDPIDESTLDGTNGFVIGGFRTSNIGRPVSGDGDFNGDGISDFIIGNPFITPEGSADQTGEAYIIFGGDHYAMPLNTGYPQAITETTSGFTLVVNGPETGTIHYAIYPGNFSGTIDHDDILNGVGAVTNDNFLMDTENIDIQEVISSLTADTTYDVYLFLEDGIGNQGEIYFIDNITTLSTACPYIVPCEERDALIALYNATDGPNWTNNTNWLTNNPVDTWFGVTVTAGHVTEVDFGFSGNNLNGSLPVELGDLNFLERFDMPQNANLAGTIPNELFTNVALLEIDLGNNGFTGGIPANISNLTALQSLELDNNNFTGGIPVGMYTLINLEVLNLYGNNISGPISADIQNLTSLTTLLLGDNPLGGVIPSEIGILTNLTNLNIYRANLTGTIPLEIGNLVNLTGLQLGRNQLSGSIPSSMGNLTQLTSLYLNNNTLTGAIPASLGNLSNVRLFILGPNQLTGSIPPELGALINVESFYLYDNNLSGSIPPELGGLTSVTQLYLRNNQLEGVIPASLATLPNVEDIFFHNNNLSGAFPDFTQAPNLDYRILMYGNAFQFGDFENQWNAYQTQLSIFDDSPQDRVNLEETINTNVGTNITLTTTVSGSQNNYQWYLDGNLIAGATNQNLVLNNVQPTDEGDYYCIITSDIVTDLTLQRNDIHLFVTADTEAPSITCPVDQELNCNVTIVPDFTSLVSSTDNLDPNPTITQDPVVGSAFVDGMQITFTATDASGNDNSCSIIVTTSTDTEAPTFSCIADQNLSCNEVLPDYTGLITATDNCDTSPGIVQNPAAGTVFTDGMTVEITVTDASGNSDTCQFTIDEIPDTEAPTFSCITNQNLSCNEVLPDYTGLITATDNCDASPSIVQNPAAGTAFVDGMTVEITVTDASGNSDACQFTINETPDTEIPTVTCPGDQILASGSLIPDYTSLVSASDNCDTSLSIVQSPAAGSTFTDGMSIQFTAIDLSGNTGSCSFNITTTSDTEAPEINCPTDQELACNASSIPDFTGLVSVIDNLDPNPTITQIPAVGSAFIDGMIITITATDASNNSSECIFTLNISTVSVNAGEDENSNEGEEVQLNAITSNSGIFGWTPSRGLSNSNISNPIANPLETTTYTVFFTSDEGCTAQDSVTVFVTPVEEDATKYGFSPDGDGINEFWEIDTIENYPNNRVSIYNRWGDLVFEVEGYNNTSRVFRGIANRKRSLGGDELPEGTYFFDIKIEGSNTLRKKRGFLVLKR